MRLFRRRRGKRLEVAESQNSTGGSGASGQAAGAIASPTVAPETTTQDSQTLTIRPKAEDDALSAPCTTALAAEHDRRISSELWIEAYEELKRDEPRLVDAYERILSDQLAPKGPASRDYPDNIIGVAAARKDQLKQLIELGLSRTKSLSSIEGKISDVIEPFNHLRGIISVAVSRDPAASIAWTGITAAVDILSSTVEESQENRNGLKYILERAEWYWNLSSLVLDHQNVDPTIRQLQRSLRTHVLGLYKALLRYEIQSVCLYSRSEVAVILRDLVKLDNWKAKIESIEKSEERVRRDVAQFQDENVSARLRNIDRWLERVATHQEAILDAVQALKDQQAERAEEEKDLAFLNKLYVLNPGLEKQDIQNLKGGLSEDIQNMMLDQSGFENLQRQEGKRMIWVTGGPGKGKTAFLCGLIDQLVKRQSPMVSYFFCRVDQDSSRTAKSVLSGLLWFICYQSWAITRQLRRQYDREERLFEVNNDRAICIALRDMLASALAKESMKRAVLIVDAIDECEDADMDLLKVIGSVASMRAAQWIISSRNHGYYWDVLSAKPFYITPSLLELTDDLVSGPVKAFVRAKVDQLSEAKRYDKNLSEYLYKKLSSKAGHTFLWVSLVCLELSKPKVDSRHVKKIVKEVPKGLDSLYQRMLTNAFATNDEALCRKLLSLVCAASRSLTLAELRCLESDTRELTDSELSAVVANCGSFLVLQVDKLASPTLAFTHASAREYLIRSACDQVFPEGIPHQHQQMLCKGLRHVQQLTRNIYQLSFDGLGVHEINLPDDDPLSGLRYSCQHWLDHANYLQQNGGLQPSEDAMIESFLRHDLLHWLEVLGLTKSIALGLAGFRQLRNFHRASTNSEGQPSTTLIEATCRFIHYNAAAIEAAPLQAYSSAVLFGSHMGTSEIMRCYQIELESATLRTGVARTAPREFFQEMAQIGPPEHLQISPCGRFLISGSCKPIASSNGSGGYQGLRDWANHGHGSAPALDDAHDHSLELWDLETRRYSHAIYLNHCLRQVHIFQDEKVVCVLLSSGHVRRLDISSGVCLAESSIGTPSDLRAVSFSPGGQLLAAITQNDDLIVRKIDTAEIIWSSKRLRLACFSPDGSHIVTATWQHRVSLICIQSGETTWTSHLLADEINFIDENRVSIRYHEDIISIRAVKDGSEVGLYRPKSHRSMAWCGKDISYACRPTDDNIEIYSSLETHSRWQSIPVPKGGRYTLSASTGLLAWAGDSVIRVWGPDTQPLPQTDDYLSFPRFLTTNITLSPGSRNFGLWNSHAIEVCRVRQHGPTPRTHTLFRPDMAEVFKVAFSADGRKLLEYNEQYFRFLDTQSGEASPVVRNGAEVHHSAAFSPDGRFFAFALKNRGVKLCDFETPLAFELIPGAADQVTFSHGSQHVAFARGGYIEVWTTTTVRRVYSMDVYVHYDKYPDADQTMYICFSPDDKSLAVITPSDVLLWHLESAEPSFRMSLPSGFYADPIDGINHVATGVSFDNSLVAASVNSHVWVWHVGQPATSEPLRVELPHPTKTCRFDSSNEFLFVDGGTINTPVPADVTSSGWTDAHAQVCYRGYGLSEDRRWILKDSQKFLYLPENFRPDEHPKYSWTSRVAFGDSTVAVSLSSGRYFVLQFDQVDQAKAKALKLGERSHPRMVAP